MKTALLPLAVSALLAIPALAQPGPGLVPEPKQTPVTAGSAKPGPGGGSPTGSPSAVMVKQPAPETNIPVPLEVATTPVYDEAADAKADVAAAVARAGKERKRVLVTLGGNWCGWCRSLDRTFTKNEKVSAAIAKSYVPVKVDVGRMTKNLDLAATWGADPKKGVPLLVVLDGAGKTVKIQDTEALEAGKRHDPEKVIAFLEENAGR